MTNRKCRQLVVLIAATLSALSLCSCGYVERQTPPSYSHFEQIPGDGWDPADVVSFEPWPLDSAEAAGSVYRMDLVLRYSSRNSLESLPMALTVEDERGVTLTDTIVAGRIPAGMHGPEARERTRYGVREVILPLRQGLRLTDGYAVSVSPLLDRRSTRGLLNVGIMLTRE